MNRSDDRDLFSSMTELEPDWDTAHRPNFKTEVLTVRLDVADMEQLNVLVLAIRR